MRNYLQLASRTMVLTFVFCASLSVAFAQEITGTLVGHITDQHGAAVLGAKVTIIDPAHGFQQTYQTTGEGNFTSPQLPVGVYTLTVEMQGFKKFVQENIKVNVNDRRLIDIVLETGEVTEVVTVVTETPLIQESPTQRGLISTAAAPLPSIG